jgi:hypothetical protein
MLVLAAALLLPSAAISKPSASPNLVKNGGFEQPLVGAGGYTLVNAGQSWGGWKVVGAAGNVAPISTTFQQNGIAFVAKAGRQWLDLTGGSSKGSGLEDLRPDGQGDAGGDHDRVPERRLR